MVYTREDRTSLPTNKSDLSTIYSTLEENQVYSNDNVRVCLTGATQNNFLMHQFKKLNDNRNDRIRCKIVLRSTLAPSTSQVVLQVWNGITNSWETVDSDNTTAADTDFSLYKELNALDGNYYDFDNEVTFRVYQQNTASASHQMCIDLAQISFLTVWADQYTAVNNKYDPLYTHKNLQDDLENPNN